MFDLGIQELIVIFVVALLVFGPKRLPEIARSMGKGIGELKKALDGVKTQINSELHEVRDIKELKDLDPIALKNELFKNEELLKIEEETAPPPPQKAAEIKGVPPVPIQDNSGEKSEHPPDQSNDQLSVRQERKGEE
jgi:TatA/E family protein of Tat protein translocase